MDENLKNFLAGFGIAILAILATLDASVAVKKLKSEYAGFFGLKNFSIPPLTEKKKSPQELLADALEKSGRIRALYMTADVANDQGIGATRLRNEILKIIRTTEINGLVIDVKEVCGPDYDPARLKKFLGELHAQNLWVIARIVAFKDDSQIEAHPDWYLTRKTAKAAGNECADKKYLRAKAGNNQSPVIGNSIFWRDNKGGYWMDPASAGARKYLADLGKKMIDLGFDELQFDYVRFPSDGDVENAIYPFWDGKVPKHEVMKSFFEYLHNTLKNYKPDIILSADLFGYAAIQAGDVGVGQRLDDMENNFDYLSFMVYPSHYYNGLHLKAEPEKNLPAVDFNVDGTRRHPDVVVYRSLLSARNFLDGLSSSTASTTAIVSDPALLSKIRLRPWLEDFFHEADKTAGRPYGVQKIRLEIDAAQRVEDHGWMLWNAANVYTEAALKPR